MNAEWRKLLLVCSLESAGDGVTVVKKDQLPMRDDLLELFERDELAKYLTAEELPA
jgi:succinate dehydrogenase / fumarate reductase flavoprotein subunit